MSMTGWGTCREGAYTINLRGVNSKYREIVLHSPPELFEAEAQISAAVASRVTRGRVDVYITINKEAVRKTPVINFELFKKTYSMFKKTLKDAGAKEEVPVNTVFGTEGVITMKDAAASLYSFKSISPNLEKALDDFMKMKKNEGKKLADDIGERLDAIGAAAADVKAQFEAFREDYRNRARQKLEEIMGKQEAGSITAQAVEVLDRYDINEELVRIASHISQFKKMLKEGAGGRKSDFLAQEMYREANTIASKITDSKLAHSVIVIKENTEKIREQSMNLE